MHRPRRASNLLPIRSPPGSATLLSGTQHHSQNRRKDAGGELRTAPRPADGSADVRAADGHLANYNYLWCSQSKGEKNPNAGNDLTKLSTKAEFIKALTDAFAYCGGAYASLTDASGTETIDITQENGRTTRNLRMALLILNYGHNNEIYGSMVSYLRMKSIVPPASEPRPQQKQ